MCYPKSTAFYKIFTPRSIVILESFLPDIRWNACWTVWRSFWSLLGFALWPKLVGSHTNSVETITWRAPSDAPRSLCQLRRALRRGHAQDYETCSSFDGCDRFVVAWRQNNPSHRPLHLPVMNCHLILQAICQDKSTTMCLKDGFWHLVFSGQFTHIQSVGMFGLDLIYLVWYNRSWLECHQHSLSTHGWPRVFVIGGPGAEEKRCIPGSFWVPDSLKIHLIFIRYLEFSKPCMFKARTLWHSVTIKDLCKKLYSLCTSSLWTYNFKGIWDSMLQWTVEDLICWFPGLKCFIQRPF